MNDDVLQLWEGGASVEEIGLYLALDCADIRRIVEPDDVVVYVEAVARP